MRSSFIMMNRERMTRVCMYSLHSCIVAGESRCHLPQACQNCVEFLSQVLQCLVGRMAEEERISRRYDTYALFWSTLWCSLTDVDGSACPQSGLSCIVVRKTSFQLLFWTCQSGIREGRRRRFLYTRCFSFSSSANASRHANIYITCVVT